MMSHNPPSKLISLSTHITSKVPIDDSQEVLRVGHVAEEIGLAAVLTAHHFKQASVNLLLETAVTPDYSSLVQRQTLETGLGGELQDVARPQVILGRGSHYLWLC